MSRTAMLLTPSLDECKLAAAKLGLPEIEAQKFFHYYESIGWRVGKQRMVSFQNAMAGWKLRWQERGGEVSSNGGSQSQKSQAVNGSQRAPTVWELTKIIEAKESEANDIKYQYFSEVAGGGGLWRGPKNKERYYQLRREIKELKHTISERV